jgi:hypothetical protein
MRANRSSLKSFLVWRKRVKYIESDPKKDPEEWHPDTKIAILYS